MLKRTLGRVFVAATLAVGGLALAPAPAFAAGGGCTSHPNTDPCISKSGNAVFGDFYQDRAPDSSMYYYRFDIYLNGQQCATSLRVRLTHTGRHGPWQCSTTGRNRAYAKVSVYNSSGALHYSVTSPTVTW